MRLPKLPAVGNKKTWLVLGIALGIGVMAALAAKAYLGRRMAEIEDSAKVKTVNVVVATKELKPGDRVSEATMAVRPIPVDYAHSQAVLPENFERAVGQALAYPMMSGEMLLWGLLEAKKAPTFSTRVADGHRAITVPVDEINSISGLLEPGDLVDLVLTIDQEDKKSSFVVQQKIPVLATGQRVMDDPRSGEKKHFTTVTFDMTPDQAQKIIRARASGKLTALLRNPQDNTDLATIDLSTFLAKKAKSDLLEVPVLYGGTGAKLAPEGLHLGRYVHSPASDKNGGVSPSEGPQGGKDDTPRREIVMTPPRSR